MARGCRARRYNLRQQGARHEYYPERLHLMAWFRVDDKFMRSRKVLSIPKRHRLAAVGLWTLAGTWAAGETDGVVPDYVLETVSSDAEKYAELLVNAGLWEVVPGGYVFHDWDDYQPSKADVKRERDGHAARQQAYRDRKASERDASRDRHAPVTRDAPVTVPRPDPSRPDPITTNSPTVSTAATKAKRRGTRLPDDWQPSAALIAWTIAECPAVDGRMESQKFADYWAGIPGQRGVKLDWDGTFRNWMRGAQERAPSLFRPAAVPDPVSTGTKRAMAAAEAGRRLQQAHDEQQRQIGSGA